MIAQQLISKDIIPLMTSATGSKALQWMHEYHVKHLPIVNNEQLLGLISEDDVLGNEMDEPIGWYALTLKRPFVFAEDHIFEVMSRIQEYSLTLIPVVDTTHNYLGVITLNDVLRYFAQSSSLAELGSIIILNVGRHSFSLSEIARIVESENALILSSFITSVPDSTELEVTLKINRLDCSSIIATFARYDYQIKASFTEDSYSESLQENYHSLLSYLNV